MLELDDPLWNRQFDPAAWPAMRAALTARFHSRSRDAWVTAFADTEACVTPVLDHAEAAAHPHNRHRATLTSAGGIAQPAPAPRYSTSATVAPQMATIRNDATTLADLGFSTAEIAELGL